MAKGNTFTFRGSNNKRRRGVHSKNASKGQNGYKQRYKGQGK